MQARNRASMALRSSMIDSARNDHVPSGRWPSTGCIPKRGPITDLSARRTDAHTTPTKNAWSSAFTNLPLRAYFDELQAIEAEASLGVHLLEPRRDFVFEAGRGAVDGRFQPVAQRPDGAVPAVVVVDPLDGVLHERLRHRAVARFGEHAQPHRLRFGRPTVERVFAAQPRGDRCKWKFRGARLHQRVGQIPAAALGELRLSSPHRAEM